MSWPVSADALVAVQRAVAEADPTPWTPVAQPRIGACWAAFPRGLRGRGEAGDPVWAAAVVMVGRRCLASAVHRTHAHGSYQPGLLALRMGPLMEETVGLLDVVPDVLLVDATARDHPRRAGLALHLGAALDVPTVGVTHRPLRAEGPWPPDERGATSPLTIGEEVVACWLRTRPGTRPVAVHPGWRVDLGTAVELVARAAGHRTPEPLRRARHLARRARVSEPSPAPAQTETDSSSSGNTR